MARPAFVYSCAYEMDIGQHVFPTAKFRLFRDRLIEGGFLRREQIEESPVATEAELLAVLHPEYLRDLMSFRHTERTIRSELPITRQIVEGCMTTAGGTILAARRALERGAAFHLGGGFHHGFADHAEGFCYINDVAVAAATMLAEGRVERVAVIDTDVHQGNGTARIFQNEPRVFTFSIHQERLYPVKERSDLDVGMEIECGDEEYLAALAPAVDRVIAVGKPQLVFIVAGVDPFENDQLGNLGLTMEGMRQREVATLEPLIRAGIPFVTVTGGGYSRDVSETVALHAQTVEVGLELLSAQRDTAGASGTTSA